MVVGETLYANAHNTVCRGRQHRIVRWQCTLPITRFCNIFGGGKLTNT